MGSPIRRTPPRRRIGPRPTRRRQRRRRRRRRRCASPSGYRAHARGGGAGALGGGCLRSPTAASLGGARCHCESRPGRRRERSLDHHRQEPRQQHHRSRLARRWWHDDGGGAARGAPVGPGAVARLLASGHLRVRVNASAASSRAGPAPLAPLRRECAPRRPDHRRRRRRRRRRDLRHVLEPPAAAGGPLRTAGAVGKGPRLGRPFRRADVRGGPRAAAGAGAGGDARTAPAAALGARSARGERRGRPLPSARRLRKHLPQPARACL